MYEALKRGTPLLCFFMLYMCLTFLKIWFVLFQALLTSVKLFVDVFCIRVFVKVVWLWPILHLRKESNHRL